MDMYVKLTVKVTSVFFIIEHWYKFSFLSQQWIPVNMMEERMLFHLVRSSSASPLFRFAFQQQIDQLQINLIHETFFWYNTIILYNRQRNSLGLKFSPRLLGYFVFLWKNSLCQGLSKFARKSENVCPNFQPSLKITWERVTFILILWIEMNVFISHFSFPY